MASGQTVGVFQLESQGMRDTLRKMRCGSIEEITALISLYRPGPMEMIDTYIDRKFGRAEVDYLHPSLKEVLTETYGVIIYQEQVMKIAQILAGYSLGEADLLRRAMGKKKKEEMDFQRARFVKGALEKTVPESQSGSIFDLVAKFAGYGFNKSHAAAYALISFQTGWLKANQPVEFFAASMSLDLSNTDKLAVFYQDARRFEVPVLSPDINRSSADFDVAWDDAKGAVLYALGAIRNVGLEAMKHVIEVRETGGRFADIFDFLERVDPRSVNKRALEGLAKAGAFDSIHPNRRQLVEQADVLMAYCQSVAAERASSQVSLFGGDQAHAARPRLKTVEPWVGPERLDHELAAVGFYLSGHPLDEMTSALKRKRVTFVAEAIPLAEGGARGVPDGRGGSSQAGARQRSHRREVRLRHLLRSDGRVRMSVPARTAAQMPRGSGAGGLGHGAGSRQGVRGRGALLRGRCVAHGQSSGRRQHRAAHPCLCPIRRRLRPERPA